MPVASMRAARLAVSDPATTSAVAWPLRTWPGVPNFNQSSAGRCPAGSLYPEDAPAGSKQVCCPPGYDGYTASNGKYKCCLSSECLTCVRPPPGKLGPTAASYRVLLAVHACTNTPR